MNIYGSHFQFRRWSSAPVLVMLSVSSIAFGAPGKSVFQDVCADRDDHRRFIVSCNQLIDHEGDKEAVLETLVCIATADNIYPDVGITAVYALVHLAENNTLIQEYLLRIIHNEKTNDSAWSVACKLITYVADEDGKLSLLAELKRRWESRGRRALRPLMESLAEIGDPDFLRWLSKTVRETDDDGPWHALLNTLEREVRLQGDVAQLLRLIESDDYFGDRAWLVRQALRHGASRKSMHASLRRYLRDHVEHKSSGYIQFSFVNTCEEYGLFTEQDALDFPMITECRKLKNGIAAEYIVPDWVTIPNEKRAEFYGLNR